MRTVIDVQSPYVSRLMWPPVPTWTDLLQSGLFSLIINKGLRSPLPFQCQTTSTWVWSLYTVPLNIRALSCLLWAVFFFFSHSLTTHYCMSRICVRPPVVPTEAMIEGAIQGAITKHTTAPRSLSSTTFFSWRELAVSLSPKSQFSVLRLGN